jgi:hypothetical protein
MESELGHETEVIEEDEALDIMEHPSTWLITMDGSIKPDNDEDAGMEIIMPPTEYEEAIDDIRDFVNFVKQNDGYTNESTGLHINVSMAGIDHSKLDYGKLILMSGDKHVLRQYGREYNEYAEESLKKLGDLFDARTGFERDRPAKASAFAKMMGQMRKDVNNVVGRSFAEVDFGKFTSVGIKENRIEFRSAGGDYLQSLSEIINTVNRFVVAYSIACDPQAYRKEYAKKLYKLASSVGDKEASKTSMTLFAAFNSGMLSKEELVAQLKQQIAKRQAQRANPNQVDLGEPKDPKNEREAIQMIADSWNILDMQAEMRWQEGMEIEMSTAHDIKEAARRVFENLIKDIKHYAEIMNNEV